MNHLDIILIIPAAWWIYRGFSKGLIMSIASLAGLVAGIYFSVYFSDLVGNWLTEQMQWHSRYMPQISFAVTFFLVVIVIQIIGHIFHKVADLAMLGLLNRLAGATFGLAKAAIFLGAILFVINTFDVNKKLISEETRSESRLYASLSAVFPLFWPTLKSLLPKPGTDTPNPGIEV
ncbi:MAG: CvpA family protein [Bacteroidales bacterium]|nr:CvpA family protein [Bacteroidales bacterium]MDZ4203830.1 CvpA family protein [Bacteroidales bacterium]